ncbi:hypothetical protein L1987_74135 [Smallanthus sonchifolius]|uniref:Uncharacterized protein n=1 Tax=Smallanthus sonchifolius TaxID=185202 RepID=A0ACB9A1V2_9ASTR|nr:hypothetical protein L1987_74135 [Smallanthus sonchifolius]
MEVEGTCDLPKIAVNVDLLHMLSICKQLPAVNDNICNEPVAEPNDLHINRPNDLDTDQIDPETAEPA